MLIGLPASLVMGTAGANRAPMLFGPSPKVQVLLDKRSYSDNSECPSVRALSYRPKARCGKHSATFPALQSFSGFLQPTLYRRSAHQLLGLRYWTRSPTQRAE